MNRMRMLCLGLAMLCAGAAQASFLRDSVTVHPEVIKRGSSFLLLVEDSWSSGCGGQLSFTATPTRIEILAFEAARPNVGCTAVQVPFSELIDARAALAPGSDFAPTLEVRYSKRFEGLRDDVETDVISFSAEAAAPLALESGSFVSALLPLSGLFIDQQDGTLSTSLSEYDAEGRGSWFYSAGKANGNAYIGDLRSYRKIQCVSAPCPRAAPDKIGQVLMVVRDQNNISIKYRGVLSGAEASLNLVSYHRFDFARSATLPSADQVGFQLPELEGDWIGGILSTPNSESALGQLRIRYQGSNNERGFPTYVFNAFAQGPRASSLPQFSIQCSDARPVDGLIGCEIQGLKVQGSTASGSPSQAFSCDASFAPDELGPTKLSTLASCARDGTSFDAMFSLRRL